MSSPARGSLFDSTSSASSLVNMSQTRKEHAIMKYFANILIRVSFFNTLLSFHLIVFIPLKNYNVVTTYVLRVTADCSNDFSSSSRLTPESRLCCCVLSLSHCASVKLKCIIGAHIHKGKDTYSYLNPKVQCKKMYGINYRQISWISGELCV